MKRKFLAKLQAAGYDTLLELVKELFETDELKRMAGVSYLGTFRFVFNMNRLFSRLEHLISTADSLLDFCRNFHIPEEEASSLICFGLLHDIGHIFFSHVSENYTIDNFSSDHKSRTWTSIENGSSSVVLRKFGIKISRLLKINDKYQFLLKSHLDCDTLNGITQTAAALGLKTPVVSELVTNDKLILHGNSFFYDQTALTIIREFWELKKKIYENYVYNPHNLLCEAFINQILARLKPKDMNMTEDAILNLAKNDSKTSHLYNCLATRNFQNYESVTMRLDNSKKIISLKGIDARLREKFNLQPDDLFTSITIIKQFKSWNVSELKKQTLTTERINDFLDKYYNTRKYLSFFVRNDPKLVQRIHYLLNHQTDKIQNLIT